MNRRNAMMKFGTAVAAAGSLSSARADAPRPLNATWVHGTAFEAEDPGLITSVSRYAWGATFRGRPGSSNWFHISVPVPVFTNGDRSVIEKAFVFYKTTSSRIQAVHVFDGPNKIKEFAGLNLAGDRSHNVLPPYNTWEINPGIELAWGLGISVAVTFDAGIDSTIHPDITFCTAGIDSRPRTPR